MSSGLNRRQTQFIAEYLVDFNGKQAAIRSGYSPRSAEVTASQLLSHPKVKAAAEVAMKRKREATELNEAWVLEKLRKIAERCSREDEEYFDPAGANRALELIGKHFAMFTDNIKVSDLDRVSDAEIDQRISELERQTGISQATH
jgi:phage terminase small subunit